ncbi:stage III sporulation protein AA [Gracilibacillus ureilyticus]|uniref:Stage III sporulation protein AA n=1 Tax=Gracilibacillus ureilyticus TaxID=531814 RepID=A0A1H9LXZ8_9BACI|nr:stage III sporulation protein AA [Gracilibacillus ureilyticus]SER16228.1 stage III sporulation protein AA [Gracilibacillus ureilyticus]
MEVIYSLLPDQMAKDIQNYIHSHSFTPQEIRLRINRPIEINSGSDIHWITHQRLSQQEAKYILNRISEHSIYRLEEELRQGYITIKGGHRIGISGSVIVENGSVKAIKHISSFNIRISNEVVGISKQYLPLLYDNRYMNTLVIGPPQSGKTTLLKDLARFTSSGWKELPAQKTGVVDERSEICASLNGIPQESSGLRIDVLDHCPKSEGMMMFVRSMSPEVIIVDEIGSEKDVQAILEVINAGVTIMCSVHGRSYEEIRRRPALSSLIDQKVFSRMLVLSNTCQAGEVIEVLDCDGNKIAQRGRGVY